MKEGRKMEEETSTKIVGVTFGNRQTLVRNLVEGKSLELVREPGNPYDGNAVAVMDGNDHLGYIDRVLARGLAREMDDGVLFKAFVSSVKGGSYDSSGTRMSYGANIRVKRLGGNSAVNGGDLEAIRKKVIPNTHVANLAGNGEKER